VRVLLFANNRLGAEIARILREGGDAIVGLVLHPPERRTHGEAILEAAGFDPSCVLEAGRLADPAVHDLLRGLRPDIGISANFGYILRSAILAIPPRGCVNVHPALLPYNRGSYPNVWSIIERTPAGVTLHHMDDGVDTGDIIAQREVPVDPADTGLTLYRRLETAAAELFREQWPLVRAGHAPRRPQSAGGSCHRVRDVDAIDEVDLDRTYVARDLIDLLRARTFPPYDGAYIRHGDRRIRLRLELDDI
jgi:methionyl-tRNA formyltransferase